MASHSDQSSSPRLEGMVPKTVIDSNQGSPPIALGASRVKIDQIAGMLASTWGYLPGSNLTEWVETCLGGRIYTATLEPHPEFGYLQVPGVFQGDGTRSKFDIVLSPFTGEFHDRFTIAHELGHYFLHCLAQNRSELTVRREGMDRAETEANWFAESFLMPREKFVRAWNDVEGSIPALIHRFKVAADVITMRRKSLTQLEENGFRYEGKWG